MHLKKVFKHFVMPSLLLFSQVAFSQGRVITGKVTDSRNGNPLTGASVLAKGTSSGTLTNSDGSYQITVSSSVATLVFSSVGYVPQEIRIDGRTQINVSMALSNSSLTEVVVIGYGTTTKKDLTGSVSTIKARDFNKGVITTPEQLISGKVAGVSITSNDGAPGSGSTIRIRGGSSLNASNDPLIVIDGMPLSNSAISGVANALALLNPNDIASFTILKDASATAIYGSRASNGVIIITTKKGQSGKPKFSFTSQVSAGVLAKKFPVLNTNQFKNLVNTYGSASQKALLGTASTDWQDEIYQTAISNDNNLSVSGSLKNMPYRLSAGYMNQTGILKTGYLHRISTNLNLSPSLLDDHLKIDLNVIGSFSKSRFANTSAVWGANQFDPTQPVYSKSSRYGGYWERLDPNTVSGLSSLSPKNPVGNLFQKHDIGNANRLIANTTIDYKLHFFPDLHAIANAGYDYSKGYGNVVWNDSAASVYKSFTSPDGSVHSGSRSHYESDINNWFGNFYLNYTKRIDSKNRIEAMAGLEYQDYLTTNHYFKSYAGDTAVTSYPQYSYDKPQNRIMSFLGRVNYSYNNILFLTGSFRRDGSSRFAPANRWGNFPSGAIAWSLSEMKGIKNIKGLTNLKLRLSYGVTGQQDGIGLYDYVSYYNLSDFKAEYQFGNTFYQMYRPGGYYANRKWEQTATSNLGIDYGFFNNRLSGSIEFYYKKTTDLLNQITQPAFTNFANTIVANVGSMENKGVEFTVNITPIKTRNLTWDISFNATYNKNKITKLTINNDPNYINQIAGIGGNGGIIANAVGYERGTFYVFKQIYDKTTGKPIENLYEDENRDGIINTSDLILFKSSIPKWFFGFNSNINYKEWSLAFTFRANLGNYVYNNVATNGAISKFLFSSFLANQSSDVLNTGFQGVGNYYQSNYYVQNASFLKLDNINIGYNVGEISKNVNLRLNASVQNVFTITKYKGLDPEIYGGIDNNGYPRPRTFVLSLGLDF
ncbi:MAG: TonB-dependent receptor [Bacteroidetes bacterium]|nr:TonB-dependent receptor [Bacteroidota bacterium]MBS1929564.1 TonB-dependent receptor [Bacteroidota bacterium]